MHQRDDRPAHKPVQPSLVHCLRQVMLGNNDVARCDLVCLHSGFKRHLSGRLPDDADDCASISGNVVQLVPKSHWLVADCIRSRFFRIATTPVGLPTRRLARTLLRFVCTTLRPFLLLRLSPPLFREGAASRFMQELANQCLNRRLGQPPSLRQHLKSLASDALPAAAHGGTTRAGLPFLASIRRRCSLSSPRGFAETMSYCG